MKRQFVLLGVLGCFACGAPQVHRSPLAEAESLYRAGRYQAALAGYQRALDVDPEDGRAREGVRLARKGLVSKGLRQVKQYAEQDDWLAALGVAVALQQTSGLLQDVTLSHQVDSMVDTISSRVRDSATTMAAAGQHLGALQLGARLVRATNRERHLNAWYDGLKSDAREFFDTLATHRVQAGYWGSAAVYGAWAHQLGADTPSERILSFWQRLRERACWDTPQVLVNASPDVDPAWVERTERRIFAALSALREGCRGGSQPLQVSVHLVRTSGSEKSSVAQAVAVVPGYEDQVYEVYREAEPYTVLEEETVYEARQEVRESRNCAPLPGQPAGCRTVQKEVTVQVPVTRQHAVQKTRMVEKKRLRTAAVKKGLAKPYDAKRVTYVMGLEGSFVLMGEEISPERFSVAAEHEALSHEDVKLSGYTLPGRAHVNPPKTDLVRQIAEKLADKVAGRAWHIAQQWRDETLAEARARLQEGQVAEAEELFLMATLWQNDAPKEVDAYFSRAYGLGIREVLAAVEALEKRERDEGTPVPQDAAAEAPATHPDSEVSAEEPAPKAEPKPFAGLTEADVSALEAEVLGAAPASIGMASGPESEAQPLP